MMLFSGLKNTKGSNMNNLNSLLIEGIVGSNPVITTSKKGTPICIFTLISKCTFQEMDTPQEDTIEMTVEAWAQVAEICDKYCMKGDSVKIIGRLKQNATDSKATVIAHSIEFRPIVRI